MTYLWPIHPVTCPPTQWRLHQMTSHLFSRMPSQTKQPNQVLTYNPLTSHKPINQSNQSSPNFPNSNRNNLNQSLDTLVAWPKSVSNLLIGQGQGHLGELLICIIYYLLKKIQLPLKKTLQEELSYNLLLHQQTSISHSSTRDWCK